MGLTEPCTFIFEPFGPHGTTPTRCTLLLMVRFDEVKLNHKGVRFDSGQPAARDLEGEYRDLKRFNSMRELCLFARAVVAQTSRGSFAAPKTGVKWRYWIQDASIDPDVVRFDVAEMAGVGSAGFEFLSYQSYGGLDGNTGHTVLDPTDVAFGSDLFSTATKVAVEAAIQNNITIDFTLGPAQGAGVPVSPDDVDQVGMLTELLLGHTFIKPGGSFNGSLPPPNITPFTDKDGVIRSANTTVNTLVAVLGAKVADGTDTATARRVTLDIDTVVDLTNQVQGSRSDVTISWTPTNSNVTNALMAFYYHRNGFPEAVGGFNGARPDKPGSWGAFVVDHFSPSGVEVSSQFIQDNVLSRQGIGEMLARPGVGAYMWEDSVEWRGQVWWTDAFADRFTERHGYPVNKYLPILHSQGRGNAPNLNQSFQFGDMNATVAFLNDYRDATTAMYLEYMSAFNEWSHSVGMEFSHQPAYGFDLDVAASAGIPDVPEIESLALPFIDEARQLSGGVHLGQHNLFSSEIGARVGLAISLTMTQLLEDCKSQYAAGVNIALLHGYPYSGQYPETTWPGLTTFGYGFSEMHGPRQPAWEHYKEYLDFLARTQYVLQAGAAKMDVAIYRAEYGFDDTPPFRDTSLLNAGYTYEYISPENLKLPGVSVVDKRLSPGGPAYKALVLNRVQNTTVDAAKRFLEYAQNGLSIILNTLVPNGLPGIDVNGTRSQEVRDMMAQLVTLPSVRIVQDEPSIVNALASLGVIPSVAINPPSTTLYSIRRDETPTKIHFYLYNQGTKQINFTLTLNTGFEGPGNPYFLDPWSGRVQSVAIWDITSNGEIVIPSLSLAANQSALFSVTSENAFEDVPLPEFHISRADPDVYASVSDSGGIEVRSRSEGEKAVSLSDGRELMVNINLKGEVVRELSGWQLNITKWQPPEDLNEVRSVLVPLPPLNLTNGLVPWDQLDGHTNTSGVGTYTTTFEWRHAVDGGVGIELDFGVVVHTVKAWLNGVQITTADPTRPIVDISDIVKEGTNTLRVDAASTLLNLVNSVSGVRTLGQGRGSTTKHQQYGLVAPVRLIPYGRVNIK
ncbi:hypothetical protein L218DRAFT_1075129 [Marasmius fiardii PR-910]|nr:hypothetical protein L218DRAFT_1075129 [Marasmius fiardii PR-910]